MKILMVTTYYYPNMIGGTEHSVKLLAEGLTDKGHDVYIIAADKRDKEYEEINGVKVIRFDLKYKSESILWKLIRGGFEFRNYMIYPKLNYIIKQIKPDVIHTNLLFYLSPIIWKIAKYNNIKIVHTLRDYWGICPKCTLLKSDNSLCEKQKLLCKIHSMNYKDYSKNVDIVTAPSQFTLQTYKSNKLYLNAKDIVVYNAIDFDLNYQKQIINMRNKKKSKYIIFLFIGTLDEYKGIKILINSFLQIKNNNIRLKICGDGKMKEFVEKSVIRDKRIEYLGRVHNKEKDNVFKESDVMIVPSIWYEPFGRVVIEAYKYGLPVIGSSIGGIDELLDREVSIAVKPNNEMELKNAILKFCDKKLVEKYSYNTTKIIKKYDINTQINNFEKIYNG